MKKTFLISLITIATCSAFAQTDITTATNPSCKPAPRMPANAVMVWPTTDYVHLGDPKCAPCYEYTGIHGLPVMECPNARFITKNDNVTKRDGSLELPSGYTTQASVLANNTASNLPCAKPMRMPANARLVWPDAPKSDYTMVGNPECPPCYVYTTKKGLSVMECPGLRWK